MSRSRRKTPICSHTVRGFRRGEKRDKQRASRALRRRVHVLLPLTDGDAVIPLAREVSNAGDFAKDGKGWIRYDPTLMRK